MNRDGQNKLADHCLVWILAEAEEAWWANTPSGPKSAEVTGKRRKGRGSRSSQRVFFFWHLVFKAHCTHLSYVFYFFEYTTSQQECSWSKSPTAVVVLHPPEVTLYIFFFLSVSANSWWATATSPPHIAYITTLHCKHVYLVQKYTHLDIKLSLQIEEVLQNITNSKINKLQPKDIDERLKIIENEKKSNQNCSQHCYCLFWQKL